MKLIVDIPNSEEILKKYHYHTADMVDDIRRGSLSNYGYEALYQQVREAVINEQFYKKGYWIPWTDDYKDYCTCSNCGYGEEGEILLANKTPFCSACGSDNREMK